MKRWFVVLLILLLPTVVLTAGEIDSTSQGLLEYYQDIPTANKEIGMDQSATETAGGISTSVWCIICVLFLFSPWIMYAVLFW